MLKLMQLDYRSFYMVVLTNVTAIPSVFTMNI